MELKSEHKKSRERFKKLREHRKLPEDIRENMYLAWFVESRCKHRDDNVQCMQPREIIVDKTKPSECTGKSDCRTKIWNYPSHLSDYCYYHNEKRAGKIDIYAKTEGLRSGKETSISNPVLKGSSGHGFWRRAIPPRRIKE